MELEAPLKFHVGNREHPAFLLFPKYHMLAMDKKHSLYMNGVGLIAGFSTKKKALERLREIVENANFPVKVYKVSKYGKNKGQRLLFAENTVERVDKSDLRVDALCKVFEISEWTKIKLEATA